MQRKKYDLESLMDTLVLCHDLLINSQADKSHLLRLGFIVSQIDDWYKADLDSYRKSRKNLLFFPINRRKK